MSRSAELGVYLNRIWFHLSAKRKVQLRFLIVLMMFSSFIEVVSIGAVLPFIAVLTTPELIFNYLPAQNLITKLGIHSPNQLVIPFTISFCFAAFVASLLKSVVTWGSIKLSFATGSDISKKVYSCVLNQSYEYHISRNSSEILNVISVKISEVIFYILMPLLMLLTSVFTLIVVLIGLSFVIPGIAFATFLVFASLYIAIFRLSRKKVHQYSADISKQSFNVIKAIQEGVGGVRDILIDGTQDIFCKIYHKADLRLRRAQGNNQFITVLPRNIMEFFAILAVASLAYSFSQTPNGIASTMPILATLALAIQRLLPTLQQIYASWSTINGSQHSLFDVVHFLDNAAEHRSVAEGAAPLVYRESICLNNVTFKYKGQRNFVLKNVNLDIAKGSRVGFIGVSGSGKSTLIDIILGLLKPTDGSLKIDGKLIDDSNRKSWQSHIAHVPQLIFLTDGTISENIAFGVSSHLIDFKRVEAAAAKAGLTQMLDNLPNGYKTIVGERGVQLSGGQRQRIGIARALYKNAEVLIFDEATSALDIETESNIIKSISMLDKKITILTIAHRQSALIDCDCIFEISNKSLTKKKQA